MPEIRNFISPYFLELIDAIIYDLSELIRSYLIDYIKYDFAKLISSFSSYFLDLIDYIKSHLPELKEFIIYYYFFV